MRKYRRKLTHNPKTRERRKTLFSLQSLVFNFSLPNISIVQFPGTRLRQTFHRDGMEYKSRQQSKRSCNEGPKISPNTAERPVPQIGVRPDSEDMEDIIDS